MTHATFSGREFQNGSRKDTKYFNQWENKEVLLESSWEVTIAELLDSNDIPWIRPKPVSWRDSGGSTRLYYPDFYLPDHDLYLDPKNPYCMEQDEEKMIAVAKKIEICYVDINKVIEHINQLNGE